MCVCVCVCVCVCARARADAVRNVFTTVHLTLTPIYPPLPQYRKRSPPPAKSRPPPARSISTQDLWEALWKACSFWDLEHAQKLWLQLGSPCLADPVDPLNFFDNHHANNDGCTLVDVVLQSIDECVVPEEIERAVADREDKLEPLLKWLQENGSRVSDSFFADGMNNQYEIRPALPFLDLAGVDVRGDGGSGVSYWGCASVFDWHVFTEEGGGEDCAPEWYETLLEKGAILSPITDVINTHKYELDQGTIDYLQGKIFNNPDDYKHWSAAGCTSFIKTLCVARINYLREVAARRHAKATFLTWSLVSMRNRTNWSVTPIRGYRNVLSLIVRFAMERRDIRSKKVMSGTMSDPSSESDAEVETKSRTRARTK